MKKKGNLLDWFYIIPILFLIAISITVAYIIINTAGSASIFQDGGDAEQAISLSENTILGFDNMFLFILGGLSIFVLVSSAMVFNHPAMFFISLILLGIAITVGAIMSNAFWSFTVNPSISSYISSFPKTRFIMEKLPFYLLFMGLASMIAMYVGYNQQ